MKRKKFSILLYVWSMMHGVSSLIFKPFTVSSPDENVGILFAIYLNLLNARENVIS